MNQGNQDFYEMLQELSTLNLKKWLLDCNLVKFIRLSNKKSCSYFEVMYY